MCSPKCLGIPVPMFRIPTVSPFPPNKMALCEMGIMAKSRRFRDTPAAVVSVSSAAKLEVIFVAATKLTIHWGHDGGNKHQASQKNWTSQHLVYKEF